MVSPIVAYEFPCSFLGLPQPIASTLPSSLMGDLLPPIHQQRVQVNVEAHNNATKVAEDILDSSNEDVGVDNNDHNQYNNDEEKQPGLSCPYRTIDGIASQTILESEASIADLRMKILTIHNTNTTASSEQPEAPSLAVEIWFTPILAGPESQDHTTGDALAENQMAPLLPILSIAAPSSSKKSNSHSKHPTHSRDPCEDRQLVIAQRGEFLELRYRDHYEYLSDQFFQGWDYNGGDDDSSISGDSTENDREYHNDSSQYVCRILRLAQWKLGEGQQEGGEYETNDSGNAVANLHHLVVAWKESGSVLQVFGNGNVIVDLDMLSGVGNETANPNPDFLRFWHPDFRLQLFSDSHRWSQAMDDVNEEIPKTNLDVDVDTASNHFNVNVNMDADGVFPGTIHGVSIYIREIDEKDADNLWQKGMKRRLDPSKAFFEDPKNPFEPLRLRASTIAPGITDPVMDNLVVQGRSALISVGGMDASNSTTSFWDTMVEIVEVPLYGDLVGPEDSILRIGDRIPLKKGQARIKVTYRHVRDDYFSVPTTSFNGTTLHNANLPGESFSYRLVALRKGNDNPESDLEHVLLGRSKTVRQDLIILHRNHPPRLRRLPDDVILPELQPTGPGARPWATLGKDLLLSDEADYDIDRIKVDLWAYNGTLDIDLEERELQIIAEITNCDNPSPPLTSDMDWICRGQHNRNVTFLATPSDITRILSNVKYTALHWNQRDSIMIKMYDGNGGPCLHDDERHSVYFPPNTTIREECFQTIAVINVPSIPFPVESSSVSFWRDHIFWWISLFVFFSIIFCACSCATCCFLKFRRDKKLNSVAVAEYDSPVILANPTSNDDFACIGITREDKKIIESLEETIDNCSV
eukprot:jgi/Psemu1/15589/gm1.15589_g